MPLAYDDEDGSWWRLSEGWPETPDTEGKWLLCTKVGVVPYGSFVRGNGVIRVETGELKRKLEQAYQGMFVECGSLVIQDPAIRRRLITQRIIRNNRHRAAGSRD